MTTEIPRRGQVWWITFDPAVGSRTRKTRPAVIVSNDHANRVLTRYVAVPFSSNVERIYPGNVVVSLGDTPSKLMADQIDTVAQERLRGRLTTLSRTDMAAIEHALRVHLVL